MSQLLINRKPYTASIEPPPPQPTAPVTRVSLNHITVAVLFFGSAWLAVAPALVGLGWLGSGVSLLFGILLMWLAREKAKRV